MHEWFNQMVIASSDRVERNVRWFTQVDYMYRWVSQPLGIPLFSATRSARFACCIHAHHAADEGVHAHQQGELLPIGAEAEHGAHIEGDFRSQDQVTVASKAPSNGATM